MALGIGNELILLNKINFLTFFLVIELYDEQAVMVVCL